MKKEFLQFDTVRNNAIKLAYRIYSDGFIPDVIYVSMRGGAYVGNIISEYFKIVLDRPHTVRYAAIVARSYTGVGQSGKIEIDGWTYPPQHLRKGDKILLVDDIFDSGNTINYLSQIIMDHGIPRCDLKIAVHDYKYFTDKEEQHPVHPDYWCRRHDVSIHDEAYWIHYMSHELVGLSQTEAEEYYCKKDPELRKAMEKITKK